MKRCNGFRSVWAFFAFVAFVLPSVGTHAATYYVAKTGNNTNSGSLTSPWQTVQKAADVMVAGDTVIVQSGRYSETVSTVRAGSAGSPITFRGSGDATLTRFKICHDYVNLERFLFTGCTGAATIQFSGNNIRIANNTISGTTNDVYGILTITAAGGIPSPYPTNAYISGNRLRNVYGHNFCLYANNSLVESNNISDTFMDVFRIWGHDTTIRGNTISNLYVFGENHPDVIQTFGGGTSYSYNIVFENNAAFNSYCQPCNLEAFNTPQIRDWTFRNNLFVGIAGQGNVGIPNTRWINNTFYRTASNHSYAITFLKQPNYDSEDAIVMNNAFIECGEIDHPSRGYYFVSTNLVGRFTADYNYVAGFGPGYPSKAGFTNEPHGVNGGNPLFSNLSANDFTLQPGSPAIDAAATQTAFAYDAKGMLRPAGAKWDIGAFEYSPSEPARPLPPGNFRLP